MDDKNVYRNRIVPHLWYDKEAKEAVEFYVSLFPDSGLDRMNVLHDTPSGDAMTLDFHLMGQSFAAISAGPYFTFNPSISLMVSCATADEVDRLWSALVEGGNVLMELDTYPFSKRYGWLQDRFGLSWQLMAVDEGVAAGIITPCLLFSSGATGKAEEAIRFYTGIFEGSDIGHISPYAPGEANDVRARINYGAFSIRHTPFVAMDNGYEAPFDFNESISFIVLCDDQESIDRYWTALSADPSAEQCGWIKDKFGVSWQIVPRILNALMVESDDEGRNRITEAFLKMKKFDIEGLKAAAYSKAPK